MRSLVTSTHGSAEGSKGKEAEARILGCMSLTGMTEKVAAVASSTGKPHRKAATSFLASNDEGGGRVFTGDRSGPEVWNHPEVLDYWHAKDGVDRHVVPQTKRNSNGATVVIDVRRLAPDDGGKLPVHGFIDVVIGVTNSTAQLDGFKRVRIVEALEACDDVRIFLHDPQVTWQVTGA